MSGSGSTVEEAPEPDGPNTTDTSSTPQVATCPSRRADASQSSLPEEEIAVSPRKLDNNQTLLLASVDGCSSPISASVERMLGENSSPGQDNNNEYMLNSAASSTPPRLDDEESLTTGSATNTSSVTPSRRNKRKMTEPKRRATDFSIRTIFSSNGDEDEEDADEDQAPIIGHVTQEGHVTLGPTHLAIGTTLSPHSIEMIPKGFSRYPLTVPVIYRTPIIIPPPSHPIRPSSVDSLNSVIDGGPQASSTAVAGSSRSPSSVYGDDTSPLNDSSRRPRKNYKNMTKQRRIEANARERTRVHTISAAFESLRRAVPSYSYNQRLSKLAILRIACSYILALARLAELDYSQEQDAMTFEDCVDLCTATIQAEGKAKRRH